MAPIHSRAPAPLDLDTDERLDLAELGLRLLTLGYDREDQRWSIYRALAKALDVVSDSTDELIKRIAAPGCNAIVALRSSGVAVGVLLSFKLRLPLFWFVDASDENLFPRHRPIEGLRVVLVDSHVISGGNMSRHVEVLRRRGVRVLGIYTLLDCAGWRDPLVEKRLSARAVGVRALWRFPAAGRKYESLRDDSQRLSLQLPFADVIPEQDATQEVAQADGAMDLRQELTNRASSDDLCAAILAAVDQHGEDFWRGT